MVPPSIVCGIARMGDKNKSGPEQLRVYWLAIDFMEAVDALVEELPVKGSLGRQLQRAAESIVLNIREGAAHTNTATKLYHYRVAHGSANECIGALHVFARRYPRMNFRRHTQLANQVCVMMQGLIRSVESRDTATTPTLPQPR
jgi:four helix bundle protein